MTPITEAAMQIVETAIEEIARCLLSDDQIDSLVEGAITRLRATEPDPLVVDEAIRIAEFFISQSQASGDESGEFLNRRIRDILEIVSKPPKTLH